MAGEFAPLTHPKFFAAWLRPLFRKEWIVYSKPPFGGPDYVLQYLGRYTHRVAISNHRLVTWADGQITIRWRDSADHNRQKLMSLSRDEFLRRFLLHLLPKGFIRIRHFGFLANRRRAALLPQCFTALHATPPKNESQTSTAPIAHPLWRCPKCGGPMAVVERFTAAHSNSVLRRSWPRLHEISRPHTALSARLRASRRSVSRLPPDIFFLSPPLLPSAIDSSLHWCPGCYSSGLDYSRALLHPSPAPFNLHKSRVRRASGFLLTAFSNTTPHTFFQP